MSTLYPSLSRTHRIAKAFIIATKYSFKSDYLVSAGTDSCLFSQGYQETKQGDRGQARFLKSQSIATFIADIHGR